MNRITPQPQILICWRTWLALFMILPAFLNALFFPSYGGIWWICTALWVSLFLTGYLFYLPIRYRKLAFVIAGNQMSVYSGVFYTREKSIPLDHIQFTVISRNPLERLFGLSTLVAVAAGGRVVLPGLRLQDATSLADILVNT